MTTVIDYYDECHSNSNRRSNLIPLIDIYTKAGTFADSEKLATDAVATVKHVEGVPDILMFRKNTAGFVHELPENTLANVDSEQRNSK